MNEINESEAEEVFSPDKMIMSDVKRAENSRFSSYSSKVNWTVFFLICLFTLGLWCELPLMVDELPEGWRLPSILTAITQVAQLAPFLFLLGRWLYPKHFTYTRAIFFIFSIGAVSCVFLSFLWNKTIQIGHEKRSLYLYIFNLTLSILDGISTITFLPYIGENFAKEYIIPNYIGEAMSSLLPGLLALVQGARGTEQCATNTTSSNRTSISIQKLHSRYSVSIYFLLILCLLMSSVIAFSFLNFSQVAKKCRKKTCQKSDEDGMELLNNEEEIEVENIDPAQTNKSQINTLLTLAFLGSLINYGFMPGLLSYSTLPYGNIYFNLSINLSSIFLPISIFISIWSYKVSIKRVTIEFLVSTLFSVYIVIIAISSPCPPLSQHWLGGALIVLSWILSSCLFLRVRCITASMLETHGHDQLFNYGVVTIIGQMTGGLFIYLAVNVFELFTEKPKCSPVDFCTAKL